MFVQVIEGHVSDAAAFGRQVERWDQELRPGATGYRGTTWGLADDGTAVVAAQFKSEDAARANSERPEQGTWWAALERTFDDLSVFDCPQVDSVLGGPSAGARFVQVIEGRARDREAARAMLHEAEGALRDGRPDILGMTMAWHGDGPAFTQVVYFRSEEDARSGEEAGGDGDADERYRSMFDGTPTFIDLREPHVV